MELQLNFRPHTATVYKATAELDLQEVWPGCPAPIVVHVKRWGSTDHNQWRSQRGASSRLQKAASRRMGRLFLDAQASTISGNLWAAANEGDRDLLVELPSLSDDCAGWSLRVEGQGVDYRIGSIEHVKGDSYTISLDSPLSDEASTSSTVRIRKPLDLEENFGTSLAEELLQSGDLELRDVLALGRGEDVDRLTEALYLIDRVEGLENAGKPVRRSKESHHRAMLECEDELEDGRPMGPLLIAAVIERAKERDLFLTTASEEEEGNSGESSSSGDGDTTSPSSAEEHSAAN